MSATRSVPCGSCTACCQSGELIVLHPEDGDRPQDYRTRTIEHPLSPGRFVLALEHNPDGSCVYLDKGRGCTIHDRAPAICRSFDCRRFVLKFDKAERRAMLKSGMGDRAVFQAGFDRLSSLPEDGR